MTTELEDREEIEVTLEMIEAGLAYLEEAGVNCFTTRTAYPDFVIGFYRAIVRCGSIPPGRVRIKFVCRLWHDAA
jgi:hypothetical protein